MNENENLLPLYVRQPLRLASFELIWLVDLRKLVELIPNNGLGIKHLQSKLLVPNNGLYQNKNDLISIINGVSQINATSNASLLVKLTHFQLY